MMEIDKEIMEQFQYGPDGVTAEARILFRKGLSAVLKANAAVREAWLIWVKRARLRYNRKNSRGGVE